MTAETIKDLFASDIDRRIEEVIKVDQADETDHPRRARRVRRHRLDPLPLPRGLRRTTRDHRQKPNEGIAVWVSGFFGSGKSSFAKYPRPRPREPRRPRPGRRRAPRPALPATRRSRSCSSKIAEQHPHRGRHLRRLHRPRHPHRQPEHHRDHVPALPAEPRLRTGPRPLGARDHPGGGRPPRRLQGQVPARSSTRTGTTRRARSPSPSSRRAA